MGPVKLQGQAVMRFSPSLALGARSSCPLTNRSVSILRPTAPAAQAAPICTSLTRQPYTTKSTSFRNHLHPLSSPNTITSARNASTSTDAARSSASPSAPEPPTLSWNEFLRLRRIRRYFNLGGSLTMGLTGFVSGVGTLATEDIGGWGAQMFGLDPLVIMGIFTTSCAGVGWLLGPLVGTSVFGLFYRRFGTQMRVKERDFFERIKRYRVDPTSSSMSNPVPDYYGEKITSVAGYRRWLKDQRAFNKKRQSFV